jgi:hypothetical protein
MGIIIQRQDLRRSKRKIRVPQHALPPVDGPWSNEESDEDPSYIPPASPTSSSDDEISLHTESDGEASDQESVIASTETESVSSDPDI